ncbi:hypothetical protein RD792_014876 [Penstemon davidsonii]|uniref:Uncharacterized protein n=1 Tax=Penstemon davidsonii TaxID=160366 RepID=A0ABR0CQL4_9LAMI|nr:hypothetical protein RD792_014876 [Penstemon davidsonii]
MGRHSCSVKQKMRKGLWSPEEDEKLYNYITRFGVGCWSSVPKLAGLQRCGKSCRLRWINYLRPDLKRGMFSQEEEDLIINLHEALGNRWAKIAAQLPGRTDNEIKNLWNSSLKKKLMKQGIDPNTHKPIIGENEKECMDSALLLGGQIQDSRENLVYDPLFLSEFQAAFDHSNFMNHFPQNLKIEGNPNNPNCGLINSMPNLTKFNHQNITDTHYCESSASKLSGFMMNEAKESSSNSSNTTSIAINNMVENPSTFSWDDVNKFESVFQFNKANPWQEESSEDYSNFPLTSLSQELTRAHLDDFQI